MGGTRRPYYVRELARSLAEQVNSIRRELENLKKIGLLQAHTKRGKRYYTVNLKFPALRELTDLVLKISSVPQDKMFSRVDKLGRVKLVVLTGFFSQVKEADTDILIVGNVGKGKIESFIARLEEQLDEEINYTVMPFNEYEYRMTMGDRFLLKIFDNEHTVLVDRISRKKRVKK